MKPTSSIATDRTAPRFLDAFTAAATTLAVLACPAIALAQDSQPSKPAAGFSKTQERGCAFLMQNQENGRFFLSMPGRDGKPRKMFDVGMTGLALAALQSKPVALRSKQEQEAIDKGLAWILENQSKAGSFGERTATYSTSSVVFALTKANRPEYKEAIERAKRFLLATQNTDSRDYAPSDPNYGSFGYGGSERGDLSNTNFAVEALRAAGVDAKDESLAKAIVFLQRLQNLREVNKFSQKTKDEKTGKTLEIVPGDDGGATYFPGNSPAGMLELDNGASVPRSYGSMTYALLKTYTLCGIRKDDPRVKAAFRWIQDHWTVDVNPGADPRLGEKAKYQGLFYYYMAMAQALDLLGVDKLKTPDATAGKDANEKVANEKNANEKDAAGKSAKPKDVDWRRELREKLAAMQAENGGWRNGENGRWFENVDMVCTAYAMLALEHCQ